MSASAEQAETAARGMLHSLGRAPWLIMVALPLCGAAVLMKDPTAAVIVFVIGTALLSFAVGLLWLGERQRAHRAERVAVLAAAQHADLDPHLLTDFDGRILALNPAAMAQQGPRARVGALLAESMERQFAAPTISLQRLAATAARMGVAREVLGGDGVTMTLTVVSCGDGVLHWRLQMAGAPDRDPGWRDAVRFPLLAIGEDGRVVHQNRAARELLGGHRATVADVFGAGFTGGGVYGIETPDGPRKVIAHVGQGADGLREIVLLDSPDVASATLAQSQSDFDTIPIALARLTRSGVIVDANAQALDMLGPAAAPGAQFSRLVQGLGRPVRDWLEDVASGRAPTKPEMVQVRGREGMFVRVALNPVRHGDETALVAVLTDATDLKNLEEQFVQSQKMQAIGQLAGGVAHDFNNLLTAISGHCDLLLMRHDRGDPDYGDLVQINQNANRAASLVGQLLAFSRKQNLHLETLDLRDTMSELIHLLNRLVGEKVTLELAHEAGLPSMRADKRQLEQVLMNLVVNARDAMPNGGTIRIETRVNTVREPFTRDRVVVPRGCYVSISVTDDGIGIAADKKTKIFEPFYTTKALGEGTGLGLSTAYGIVKQTGGYIFVDSTEGEGSTFTLLFPAHSGAPELTVAEPAAQPSSEGAAKTSSSDGVVLLVEDEAPVRAFASRALRMRGYTVLEAECAEDALSTLEDPNLHVDVFVTDVVMPGMDGPSWVRKARKDRPDVRVVFVSGYAEDSFNDKQGDIPNSVFLPKPFSLNELTEMVQGKMH